MAVRNITKALGGMEDLLNGVGTEVQIRNEASYTIGKIDVPYAVNSIVELQGLDVSLFTRARVYHSTLEYADYIYDATSLDGIVPDEGAGTWLFNSIKSATSANLALLAADVNTVNKYEGKQVWDVTANRPVWAVGPLAADLWVYADGTTAQTPV